MKLADCLPHLIYEFKNEHELILAIEELSLKFTKNRENIGDYLTDERLVSAYTAFYLTTNIPKLSEVFKWLPVDFVEELKKCELVDLGAGPGTFSLAFKELGAKGKITQVEKSQAMRLQAKKLWDGLYPDQLLTQETHSTKKSGSLLLFGHSANEMGFAAAIKYIEEIDPDHILFIEPGTKIFFKEMLKIRERLVRAGFEIVFPCPNSINCPLASSEEDWCHQFIQVTQEPGVERLSQILKKDRRLLPLIVQVFSKKVAPKDQSVARLVRVFPETKFSFDWEACVDNKIMRLELPKRGMSKKTQKELKCILSGASLEFQTEKVLEKSIRIKLIKLNNQNFNP